jgi:monoterpene epsilon-lactone hydrolase
MPSRELTDAIDWERRLVAANATADGIAAVRSQNAAFMAERAGEPPAGLVVERVDAGGVPAEWVHRGEGFGPVLLFLHSGGCVVGSAAENRELLGRLTKAAGGRALAVDFRLAPEYAWPAQRDDACVAYRWLLTTGHAPDHIVVVGESGGGGVALAALQTLRDEGTPLPAAAVFLSPLADFALTAPSLDTNDTDPFVNRPALEAMMAALLQGQDPAAASPINGDYAGLPPLLVQVGTAEAILDDARRTARRAEAAGVDTTFEAWDEMIHLWHGFPELPEAAAAIARIGEFVSQHVKSGN